MNKEHIFAYLAGYTDGDGCFCISSTTKKNGTVKFTAQFVVSSTNQEILTTFQSFFGGTVRKSSDVIKHHKVQYQFTATGNKAKFIAETLVIYLIEKKQQAECFLEYFFDINNRIKIQEKLKSFKTNQNLVTENIVNQIRNTNTSITPSLLDYIYFAGFIDAECCLGIQKYKSKERNNFLYKMYFHCNNTKYPVINWIKERFSGHVRFINRSKLQSNHKDQICIRISAKTLSQILPKICEYLRYKKPVCVEMIKFSKLILKNGGARHTEEFRSSYEQNLIQREKICQIIHNLNQKGILS